MVFAILQENDDIKKAEFNSALAYIVMFVLLKQTIN